MMPQTDMKEEQTTDLKEEENKEINPSPLGLFNTDNVDLAQQSYSSGTHTRSRGRPPAVL